MREHDRENRVLVLMPTVRDAATTAEHLNAADVATTTCHDLAHACREVRAGAGALLVTDDFIIADTTGQLAEALRSQPTWSAIPIIVIAHEGATQLVQNSPSDALTGIVVIERPVRTRSLVTMVLSALRARRHQYQIRDAILAQQKQAAELEASRVELARQAEQLRTNDKRKDEFLATLAHELRNPLAPIRTGVDILRNTDSQNLTERTLGIMDRQLSHMVRLIDDLLDVSRITRGKLELKKSKVTLGTVIDAAVEELRPQVERGKHTLRLDVRHPELVLEADPTRIQQVVGNLLNNATKYTEPGGVIELFARAEGTCAVIEVRDNGFGIAEDRLDEVFEMFSQVDPRVETAQGGLGIGLALVRSLVEMHGGAVSAKSDGVGKGSTFRVELPICEQLSVADASESVPRRLSPETTRRVLVVDDNVDAADMLALLLEKAGYATTTAYDSHTALECVERERPDVVILDIGLPDLNGYDVARRLRQKKELAPLGLIALTGWGTSHDKQKAKDAGFDFHITKPVDSTQLHRALQALETNEAFLAAKRA